MKRFSISLALIFITGLGFMALGGFVSMLILLFYIGISLATYLTYWWDKSAARKGNWRTPESTLHCLSLTGGWPGALIAQQILRHKTQKRSFRLVFWLMALANFMILVWLFTQGFLGGATP